MQNRPCFFLICEAPCKDALWGVRVIIVRSGSCELSSLKVVRKLPCGSYYLRVKANSGAQRWTNAVGMGSNKLRGEAVHSR